MLADLRRAAFGRQSKIADIRQARARTMNRLGHLRWEHDVIRSRGMRALPFLAAPLLALACCSAPQPPPLPMGAKVDRIVVVKHQGWLTAYSGGDELVTYFNIDLGGAPAGRKRFEGDGLVPEGEYVITRGKPDSRNLPSLSISYPNAADRAYAKARGRSAGGGIMIYGAPVPMPRYVGGRPKTDGDIGLRHAEIRQLQEITPDGTPVTILP